ncbi:MAG TPA: methyltransferase [Dissulfurispiraceae bacterium]|nr:methyltransferase [Dissulfurispiraceae bacterium]
MKVLQRAEELRKIWSAFCAPRVLMTANEFGIFDLLTEPLTADRIAAHRKTDLRATTILLDALTGLGLLRKKARTYRNSPLVEEFLVRGKPSYQGDIIRHAAVLWNNWSGLDEVLRSGTPSRGTHNHEAFIRGMHNIAVLKAKQVMAIVGLRDVRSAIDIGGGPGTYAIEMARCGIDATLFDFPETLRIAKKIIRQSGVKGIRHQKGDFLRDPVRGSFDLALVSQVLHAYSETDNLTLLKKVRRIMNPGGRIAIQEFFIKPNLASPSYNALFAVNMLVNTEGGRCYSVPEMKKWLKMADFVKVKVNIIGDSVMLLANAADRIGEK